MWQHSSLVTNASLSLPTRAPWQMALMPPSNSNTGPTTAEQTSRSSLVLILCVLLVCIYQPYTTNSKNTQTFVDVAALTEQVMCFNVTSSEFTASNASSTSSIVSPTASTTRAGASAQATSGTVETYGPAVGWAEVPKPVLLLELCWSCSAVCCCFPGDPSQASCC